MTEDFMRAYKTTVDFWTEDFKIKPLLTVDVKEVSAGALGEGTGSAELAGGGDQVGLHNQARKRLAASIH